jgi:hypothetical protein
MYSIESVRSSSKNCSNRKISLKLIEKRLKHLREELRNLTRRKITTSNLLKEQQTNEYQMQYNKRFNQLFVGE